MPESKYKAFFIFSIYIAFITISIYFSIRIYLFITADYPWYNKILAFILLVAEGFVLMHTVGYFLNILRVMKKPPDQDPAIDFKHYPPVAVVLASYKEPLHILRDTLICFYNLSYPNKHLYVLDDTRYELPWDTEENKQKYKKGVEELCEELETNLFRSKWHGAKAGKVNDFLQFLHGEILEGFQVYHYDKKDKKETAKYILIFDADMNPLPAFLEDLVWKMEVHPNLAFVQTPQYYTNFETNRVACAAGLQQAIFYEYICEGKGLKGAMFCCGTNVLFRVAALREVGGFDHTSVTEDFATSIKLHMHGWRSLYINKVLAFGLGPEDLGGYFKQQFRWARGTVGILRELPKLIWQNFSRMPLLLWWEYFLPCTHYFVGVVFLIMVVAPIIFLFFDIPSYFTSPTIYLLTYVPYFLMTSLIFFSTLIIRNYRMKDLGLAIVINAVAFPVYTKACIYAMLGIPSTFGITPKGSSSVLSLRSLVTQIVCCVLCAAAAMWGVMRLYYEREPFYALIINVFWCIFNFYFISYFLYFNQEENT